MAAIIGARALIALLVAEMSVNRLTSCSGVEPVSLHSANASPNACHDTISGRLIASLTDAAAPTGPQWSIRRQSCFSSGCARSASIASAPSSPTS